MRIALLAICLLITTCALSALPSSAQCTPEKCYSSMGKCDPEEMTRQQEYEALRTKFYYSARQAVHVMITAPATKTTIELKESLRKVCDLEQDYIAMRNAGVNISARTYAGQYINLLTTVAELHEELTTKCRAVKGHVAEADQAWLMMREEYANLYYGDRLDIEERAAQVADACRPLTLGLSRIAEMDQEVAKSVQAQLKKNPNQPIDMAEELVKAAEVILERHLTNPPSSTCP